jgi:hypothetical protein
MEPDQPRAGTLRAQGLSQIKSATVGRYPDRFVDVLEAILDHNALMALAQQQSDGRIVPLRAHYAVHCGEAEVQLTCELPELLKAEVPSIEDLERVVEKLRCEFDEFRAAQLRSKEES